MSLIKNTMVAGIAVATLSIFATPGLAAGLKAADPTQSLETQVQHIAVDARTQRTFDRQFRPHTGSQKAVWTSKLKAASGNPNIVVFDRRHGFSDIFECSYITYRGERAIVCQ